MNSSGSSMLLPLYNGFVTLPQMPYPKAGLFRNYISLQQSQPNITSGYGEGLRLVRQLNKNSWIPGSLLGLSNLALTFMFSKLYGKLAITIGLTKEVPAAIPSTFDIARDIGENHIRMIFLNYQKNELIERISDDLEKMQEIRNKLQDINQALATLAMEQRKKEEELKNSEVELRKYQKEKRSFSISNVQILIRWFLSTAARMSSMAILYPLYTVGEWYIHHQVETTWKESFYLLKGQCEAGSKNPYDGFMMYGFNSMLKQVLMIPCMSVLKRTMKLPDRAELGWHLENLAISCLVKDMVHVSQEDKKRTKESFRVVMKNSLVYCFANWMTSLALFPLFTVQKRLVCQGSPHASYEYSGPVDAYQKILAVEGIQGFYRGFSFRALMIVPELTMWAILYQFGDFLIDLHYKQ